MANAFNLEKIACLEILAAVMTLKSDPTPKEFEAFLAALGTFQPLPPNVTPESLLSESSDLNKSSNLDNWLSQVQTPALQQQVYRGAYTITRFQGIDPKEATLLTQLAAAFQFAPETIQTLTKQPLKVSQSATLTNSSLAGITALIGREGKVRRLIFDYALGAAIVGLIPINGGGSLEVKLLAVLALVLKMSWDIRNLWGKPRGQDLLALIGRGFGVLGAVLAGFLAWSTMIGLGTVIPYMGAFGKAAAFATATWTVGQSTNQYYTSPKRPDLSALKRVFPTLMSSDQ